jgi:SAM-dependent methyltransferase
MGRNGESGWILVWWIQGTHGGVVYLCGGRLSLDTKPFIVLYILVGGEMERDDLYAKNIEFLKGKDYKLFRRVEGANLKNIQLINSKSGAPTLFLIKGGKSFFLHSRYDPIKEAKTFLDKFDLENASLYLILGLGLAYHVVEVLRRGRRDAKIFVIEENVNILKAALSAVDLTSVLADERVRLLVGESVEQIIDSLKRENLGEILIIQHLPSEKFSDYYKEVRVEIKRKILNWSTYDIIYSEGDLSHPMESSIQFLTSLISECKLPKGSTILDLGCGRGFYTYLFWRLGMNAYGIDLSKIGVEQARRDYLRRADGGGVLEYIQGDAREMNFPKGMFDLIFSRGLSIYNVEDLLFEHVLSFSKYVLEFLKDDGTFCVVHISDLSGGWNSQHTLYNHRLEDFREHFSNVKCRIDKLRYDSGCIVALIKKR